MWDSQTDMFIGGNRPQSRRMIVIATCSENISKSGEKKKVAHFRRWAAVWQNRRGIR